MGLCEKEGWKGMQEPDSLKYCRSQEGIGMIFFLSAIGVLKPC